MKRSSVLFLAQSNTIAIRGLYRNKKKIFATRSTRALSAIYTLCCNRSRRIDLIAGKNGWVRGAKIRSPLPKNVTRCYPPGCCFLGSSGATPTVVAMPELFPTLHVRSIPTYLPPGGSTTTVFPIPSKAGLKPRSSIVSPTIETTSFR